MLLPELLLIFGCPLLILCLTYIAIRFFIATFISTESQTVKEVTGNDIDKKAYIFEWKIQNVDNCQYENGEWIQSPTFIADALKKTRWSLHFCPEGPCHNVSFNFKRENDNFCPHVIKVNYQLGILEKYCTILEDKYTIRNTNFNRNMCDGNEAKYEKPEVFDTKRIAFITEDTLTIQCIIWEGDEKPKATEFLSARTVLNKNRRNFMWKIENFSTLKPGIRSDFTVMNELKEAMTHFYFVINDCSYSEREIAARLFDDRIRGFLLKVSIVDAEGKKVNCGYLKRPAHLEKASLILSFPKDRLVNLHLPNDVLSLDCELVYTTETALYEGATRRTLSSESRGAANNKNETNVGEEKTQISSMLLDDLKSMYSKAICSDMELRTSTQTFPVHKSILSARSTVFRKMFNSDMKGPNSGHVDIVDLEDETLQKMLTYIYTDSVDDLGMESASKLYSAADKYDIPPLKRKCSSFLKDNLCLNSVCDVLILAEMHQDHDLKSAAKNYIMNPTKKLLSSKIKNVSWPPNFNN